MKKHLRVFLSQLEDFLEPYGAVIAGIENGGRHSKVLIQFGGRTMKRAIPGTPSDHRAMKNFMHQLRHEVAGR